MRPVALLTLSVLVLSAHRAWSAPLTADEAVRIALQKNSTILQSEAGVLSARGGLWSAYSRVTPSVGANGTRNGQFTREATGTQAFGSIPFSSSTFDREAYSGSYGLSGRWSVLDPSALVGLSAARAAMKGASLTQKATRADVRLETRRRFYTVVRAMHLARVSAQALKLSRDDERRVRALFQVGSVSRSDLLQAQVRTEQSQLDSLVADHTVITQRISLAQWLAIPEQTLPEVDSTLSASHEDINADVVLAEARKNRPDIRAAEANLKSAELDLRSAHWSRLPSVSVSGSYDPSAVSSSRFFRSALRDTATTVANESKKAWSGQLSLDFNLFDGFATDARVASARSGLIRARDTRDALVRDLEGEVRATLLTYQEAVERESLAGRGLAAAAENLNLVQQKYNVGSATILDLINAELQLQRSQSDLVSALADIRVAEAAVERVRGAGE